jgi:hypothetical protein
MDYTQQDWNSFAKGLMLLPDEALRAMLDGATQGEATLGVWEDAWKSAAAAFGFSNEELMRNNRPMREIGVAFVRAEAARRKMS